jgi:hypothetical protein
MHAICKPFQVNFYVLPFKKPSKYFSFVTLFSAHGDVVVGFAIFLYCFIPKMKKRKKEKKKKRYSSMVCESWWAPDGIS